MAGVAATSLHTACPVVCSHTRTEGIVHTHLGALCVCVCVTVRLHGYRLLSVCCLIVYVNMTKCGIELSMSKINTLSSSLHQPPILAKSIQIHLCDLSFLFQFLCCLGRTSFKAYIHLARFSTLFLFIFILFDSGISPSPFWGWGGVGR